MGGIVAPPGVVWWRPDLKSGAKIRWQGLLTAKFNSQNTAKITGGGTSQLFLDTLKLRIVCALCLY